MSHPVLHRLLHQGKTLPTGVKLVFVGTFKVHQVADDLREKVQLSDIYDMITTSSTFCLYLLTLITAKSDLVSSSECSRM